MRSLRQVDDRWLRALGTVVVFAPHPDDESLGCGGAIVKLRRTGTPVDVIFITDGTESHPDSRSFPRARLGRVRRAEALAACRILGVARNRVHFMGLPDRYVPSAPGVEFDRAVRGLARLVDRLHPDTLLVPWRGDGHSDHEATFHLAVSVLRGRPSVRMLEYGVWLWMRRSTATWPDAARMTIHRLALAGNDRRKRQAIACHRSQTTDLIDDDANGFRLSAGQITAACGPYEVLMEAR